MMAPVTAIFAGLYLDDIAGRVEARHYGQDPKGMPLSGFRAVQTSLQFALDHSAREHRGASSRLHRHWRSGP